MRTTISLALLIIVGLIIAPGCNPSRIVLADPSVDLSVEQDSITTPHDLVVAHYGCGTSNSGSLEAFLDEGEANERDISDLFEYDSELDAWIAEDVDLPTGQHRIGARAHVTTSGTCYRAVTGMTRDYEIVAHLEGEHQSLLHHEDDVDSHTIMAPASNFGSWFEITVQAVDPPSYRLYSQLIGPAGSLLEDDTATSRKYWIALKSGVQATVDVQKGAPWPDATAPVDYKITVVSSVIPDSFEFDDDQEHATELRYDETKFAYMCGVMTAKEEQGDLVEETVGLEDWFKYDHEHCMNDSVVVSQRAVLQNCKSPVPGECSGCDTVGTELNMDDHGCGEFKNDHPRYVSVRHPDYSYVCYGKGDVPSHYTAPYTIRVFKDGDVFGEHDCVDSK